MSYLSIFAYNRYCAITSIIDQKSDIILNFSPFTKTADKKRHFAVIPRNFVKESLTNILHHFLVRYSPKSSFPVTSLKMVNISVIESPNYPSNSCAFVDIKFASIRRVMQSQFAIPVCRSTI